MALLAVPILIHLWQRRQVKKMRFGSLRFLKAIATRTTRLSKIENLLLLLLRCLLLALLVLAFARPVINTRTQWLPGTNVPRTVVFVIDHSMSMNYRIGNQTRLETVKKEAQTILDTLKEGDSVAVLAASDRVEFPLGEPTLDRAAAARAIEEIRPTQAATNFSPALLQAKKILAGSPAGRREIFLLTDNQESGWQFDPAQVFDAGWKSLDIEFVTVQPDKSSTRNGWVKNLTIPALVFTPGRMAQAEAEVFNARATPLSDVLSFECQDERVAQQAFTTGAQSAAVVPVDFAVPSTPARWMAGRASISADNLPDDDQLYYVRPVDQQRPSLIVVTAFDGPARMRADFFLRKALSPQANEVASVTPEALNDTPLDPYGTVFLVDPGRLNDRAVVKLNRFLDNGGVVVYFPGAQTNTETTGNLDFLSATPTGVHELPPGRLATRILKPSHPLFANVWDAGTPFPALPQHSAMGWKLEPGSKVLLTLGESEPFLISAAHGPGVVLVINATVDRTWGDFPLSSAFLPLLQQVRLLSALRDVNHLEFLVGSPVPWPPGLPKDQTVTLVLPDHSTKTIPGNEQKLLLDRAEFSGIHQAQTSREEFWFAVNIDPRESNLTPLPTDQRLEFVPQTNIETPVDLEVWLQADHGVRPLWPVIFLLATLCLGAEFLAANHFASKRTQGEESPVRTGRLFRRMRETHRSGGHP